MQTAAEREKTTTEHIAGGLSPGVFLALLIVLLAAAPVWFVRRSAAPAENVDAILNRVERIRERTKSLHDLSQVELEPQCDRLIRELDDLDIGVVKISDKRQRISAKAALSVAWIDIYRNSACGLLYESAR